MNPDRKGQTTGPQTLPMPYRNDAYYDEAFPLSMMLDIDGTSWTPMTEFDGDRSRIQYLRESMLFTAHHLRPDAEVLIIGIGGGRDILAALAFNQPRILGIELNPLMERIVNDRYADFTGRPYYESGVDFIIDEARSRLESIDERFDIIQLSLIDTFSLNAAGGGWCMPRTASIRTKPTVRTTNISPQTAS